MAPLNTYELCRPRCFDQGTVESQQLGMLSVINKVPHWAELGREGEWGGGGGCMVLGALELWVGSDRYDLHKGKKVLHNFTRAVLVYMYL